jgi:hypothetical protein
MWMNATPQYIYKSMCLHNLELPKMKGMEHDMDECLNPPHIWINVTSQLEPSMNGRNKSCGWICNPTIHLNQYDFTTWISMNGWNKSCGWICNPSIHLNQCDFTTWTSTNEQNEWYGWMIWMNVTPPYIYELKATGWIEFDCIRTMIKNGEDLLTKSFPTTKAPNWVLPDMFKTNRQREDPKNRRYYTSN